MMTSKTKPQRELAAPPSARPTVVVPPRECPCGCGEYEGQCRYGGVWSAELWVARYSATLQIRQPWPHSLSAEMHACAAAHRIAGEAALALAKRGDRTMTRPSVDADLRITIEAEQVDEAARILRDAAAASGVAIVRSALAKTEGRRS